MKRIFCGTWKEWKLFLKKHGNKTLGELANDPKKPELAL